MNGISLLKLLVDQFHSNAPPEIAGRPIRVVQYLWLVVGVGVGVLYFFWGDVDAGVGSVLAANAIFTALSLTMAMFFWPKAINLKNDANFLASPSRWHVYRLTTQLFWTVLVGITASGIAVVLLGLDGFEATLIEEIGMSVSVGLTAYQVLLLGQSVLSLYAATFWISKI